MTRLRGPPKKRLSSLKSFGGNSEEESYKSSSEYSGDEASEDDDAFLFDDYSSCNDSDVEIATSKEDERHSKDESSQEFGDTLMCTQPVIDKFSDDEVVDKPKQYGDSAHDKSSSKSMAVSIMVDKCVLSSEVPNQQLVEQRDNNVKDSLQDIPSSQRSKLKIRRERSSRQGGGGDVHLDKQSSISLARKCSGNASKPIILDDDDEEMKAIKTRKRIINKKLSSKDKTRVNTTGKSKQPRDGDQIGMQIKKRKITKAKDEIVASTTTSSKLDSASSGKKIAPTESMASSCMLQSKVPKKKKQTFQDQVLTHISKTMKPFTLKTLAAELRTTDIALHHLMLSLLDKNFVKKKEFGNKRKKEIYCIDLDYYMKSTAATTVTTEEMGKAKALLKKYAAQESTVYKTIQDLSSDLSNDELERRLEEEQKIVQDLQVRVSAAKERIASQKSGPAVVTGKGLNNGRKLFVRNGTGIKNSGNKKQGKNMVTSKDIKIRTNFMRNEWKIRKEKCADFMDNLADAMEKKIKVVYKTLNVETDEMYGVKLPPKLLIED